jgi:type I restriction enzyme S subunit
MIDGLKPYPEYKDSGVPWLDKVPAHWEVRRQRNVANMLVSNVDKHTIEGEIPVRLCNYVDVYKHDVITDRIPFMRATASHAEINRFRLQIDDVVITKDSETWDDIGVPALVAYEAPDLVCGYHLAILRPRKDVMCGAFLLRALQSQGVAAQYYVSANGVTRFGLSHDAIKSVSIPVPPLPEQQAIARFLDHHDRLTRRYIRAQRRLIELLEEQKQALIQQAVTCGLDPDVPLKDSGIPWLGEIPAHWDERPAKYFFREVDERSQSGEEELLSVSHITGVTPRSQKSITMFKAESYVGYKLCRADDLVINTMWAWMAALGVAKQTGIVSSSYAVYRPTNSDAFVSEYVDHLLRTKPYVSEYICRSTGIRSSRLRLYPEQFLKIPLICPPYGEQKKMVKFVEGETLQLDQTITRTQRQIDLIREYRTRLIADVVTGKLDVRDVSLPAESAVDSELGDVENPDGEAADWGALDEEEDAE